MGREKPNFREMLEWLTNEKKLDPLLDVKEVTAFLRVGRGFVKDRIDCGDIRTDKGGKIPIGALASYLLGNAN